MNPLKLLLGTLEELTGKELKKFQLFLTEGALEGFERIPKGKLEKCDPTDTAGMMREVYGSDGALRITLLILKEMNHNNLADNLERGMVKNGSRVLVNGQRGSDDAIRQYVSQQLMDTLINKYASILEGPEETKVQLDEVYTELHVTEGVREEVNTQHEVQQIQTQAKRQTKKDTRIKCNDIMKSSPGNKARTVMTIGIAGIGKSVSVQKFCLDWAKGRANQDIDFIFVLPFRELNLLEENMYSLLTLLMYFYPVVPELNDVTKSKILFIFDGLDETKLELDFKSKKRISDVTQTSPLGLLLVNLIKGHLLNSSLIWITSRPAAANQIPSCYIDKWTEIRGFDDKQKDKYFSKRIVNTHCDEIISQIKTRRSLYTMCHIPVFCWIIACVINDSNSNMEIPSTMTELFIHFLLIQTNRKNQRCLGESETDRIELLKRHKQHILKLSELAFKQLEKENILFSKKDLRECGIKDGEIKEYSEMCTEIFKKDHIFFKKSFYCFVHLSVQEFLAALHVFYSFVSGNATAPGSFTPNLRRSHHGHMMPLHVFLNQVVDESLKSQNGHYDLFLRFLLGISLESSQELLEGLLLSVEDSSASVKTTSEHIKEILSKDRNSVERCQNLLLCLLEMKDSSLHEEIERLVKSGEYLRPELCSVLAYMLLMSEEVLDEFNLTMYNTAWDGPHRLLTVLRGCRKARLSGRRLGRNSFEFLSSVLQSESSQLRELDLSCNDLEDSGMELLSVGLKHTNCRLETLGLAGCRLSGDSYNILSSVLQSESSQLKELDLSCNRLEDSGVELLSAGLTNCRLETLGLAACDLTSRACPSLASVLQSDHSHLKKLDLTNNDLGDSGVKELCAAVGHQCCKLEELRLSGCLISQRGCEFLVSALTSNPDSHLTELDLSYNHPGDAGLQMLSTLSNGKIKVNVAHSSEVMLKKGLMKYNCYLTLDPNTASRRVRLSEGNRKVTDELVRELQPYPDHPDRFADDHPLVLSREPLIGRCYWEWEGDVYRVDAGVACKSISRSEEFLYSAKAWMVGCENEYVTYHGNIITNIPPSGPLRGAVYVDREAGTVSFYWVSSDTHTHLHTYNITHTEPLHAAIGVWSGYSSASVTLV